MCVGLKMCVFVCIDGAFVCVAHEGACSLSKKTSQFNGIVHGECETRPRNEPYATPRGPLFFSLNCVWRIDQI